MCIKISKKSHFVDIIWDMPLAKSLFSLLGRLFDLFQAIRLFMKNESQDKEGKELTFDDFDKLKLKEFAENLRSILEQGLKSSIGENGSFTLSLNAEFGNGKTTFLKMFENFIKDDYHVVFIDAWRSDFYKHPLVPILSELSKSIEKNGSEENKKLMKDFGKKASKVICNMGIQLANQFIKNLTTFDMEEALDKSRKINENVNILKEFQDQKDSINEIKEIIRQIAKDKSILFIVDELDRTQPNYAVQFLEVMKHFFDIENVIFLVAVNRSQLKETVRCLYGQKLKFDGYYQKFFKQELSLPDPQRQVQDFIKDLTQQSLSRLNEHMKQYKAKYGVDEAYSTNLQSCPEKVSDALKNLHCYSHFACRVFHLTLREIEIFMRTAEKILTIDFSKLDASRVHAMTEKLLLKTLPFFIALSIKKRGIFDDTKPGGIGLPQLRAEIERHLESLTLHFKRIHYIGSGNLQ